MLAALYQVSSHGAGGVRADGIQYRRRLRLAGVVRCLNRLRRSEPWELGRGIRPTPADGILRLQSGPCTCRPLEFPSPSRQGKCAGSTASMRGHGHRPLGCGAGVAAFHAMTTPSFQWGHGV